MHQQKSKKILLYIFLFMLVGSITNISLNDIKFNKIKNIKILGLKNNETQTLLEDLKSLNLKNIFFINANEIRKIINSNNLVEKFEIFKIYPSTLFIEIEQTNFLARINKNGKLFVVGSNGKLLGEKYSNNNLPYIFGKPEIEDFLYFKNILDTSKLSYQEIKNFYFFPSMRWDIELKNNIILKLSKEDLKEKLDEAFEILNSKNISNIKIVDLRVKNQIILND